ncbi:hypothetical protein MTO96_052262 [Rhipicephalus appendiculatus]
MYRIKLKVQTYPLNTRTTKLLLAASSLFTMAIVGFKLYRIAFPHGAIRERDLPGWFSLDAFVPDRIPSDLLPDIGLVWVSHPGGYESIMFINEGRASRGVFPSFNRHSYRAGIQLDGLVRRGMVLCSSERPVDDQDDELVEDKGGPNDVFRVRFTTVDAITSDRLAWFPDKPRQQRNIGVRHVEHRPELSLDRMREPQEVFEKSYNAVTK